jgi:lysozyme
VRTSENGFDLIRLFEGFRDKAYPDPGTGAEPYTIGVGHTHGVKEGDTCTKEMADGWLIEDCMKAEQCIQEFVEVDINQNQFDALVSFIYNVGEGNFRASTLLKLLNDSKYEAAANQFGRWDKAAGHVMGGLTIRRNAEAKLFLEIE